jgi:hypothetical protein
MSSKKKSDKERDPDVTGSTDNSVEEKIKKMLDPSIKDDPKPEDTGSAPEITELPKPKEPLKIKILHADDTDETSENDAEADIEPTAPELKPEELPEEEPEPKKIEIKEAAPEDEAEVPEEQPDTAPVVAESEPAQTPEPEEPEPKKVEPKVEESDLPPVEEDANTAKAVDDIIAHESDQLLKSEDDKLLAAVAPKKKNTFGAKLKRIFFSKKFIKSFSLILVLTVAALAVYPPSRYFALNLAGVRSSLSVTVLDESTRQPLKNVEVSMHGVSAKTDTGGDVTLSEVKLGSGELLIHKRAFADYTKKVTVGWGSNPLGEFSLKPTGTQYAFILKDFLSDKGLEKIEVISGEFSALSDKDGKVLLTMDEPPDEIDVQVIGAGYRDEKLTIDADSKAETTVKMVADRKHVFISKRTGKYDVYKIDADGKNESKVLAGTGHERDDLSLISHPSQEVAALVSTRSGKRNKDGYLLSTLTVLDLKNNGVQPVTTSERVQLVDWIGNRIIFVQIHEGASAVDPKRHRLMSYDYKTSQTTEIASSNSFNDVMVANGKLYYAPSGAYQNGINVSLFRADADGNKKEVLLGKEAWNLFRTAYDHVVISAPGAWYDYRLGDEIPSNLEGSPANLVSRVYVNNPENKKSIWVDNRDGKGVLIAYDIESGKETTIQTRNGLKNPLRWLNNKTAVFRVKTDSETADYAVSLDGGEPKKIQDVTNTGGVDSWYYY